MRMDSNALKFDTQVMALAMPQESAFTKAGEGIGNIGKVFLDADTRAEASKLNALKMEEANQSIIGKQNENSIFGEKQEREKSTWLADIRNKKLDGIKKDLDNKADIKKQTDNGFMEKFEALIPEDMFHGDNGKFTEEKAKVIGDAFSQSDGWWKDNMHLYNAVVDKRRKSALDTSKTSSEIADKEAATAGKVIDNAHKPQEYRDKSDHSRSATNLNIVNAGLAPMKVQQESEKIKIAKATEKRQGQGTQPKDLISTYLKIIADGKISELIPEYDSYDEDSKLETIKRLKNGIAPIRSETIVIDKSIWGDTTKTRPVYQADTLYPSTKTTVAPVKAPIKNQNNNLPPLPKVLPKDRADPSKFGL